MSKEEKMMVLEMVAQGKITPEQGAELLRALGSGQRESGGLTQDLSQSVKKGLESSIKKIQEHVEKVKDVQNETVEKAESIAEGAAKRAQELSARTSVVIGESAANLGKLISQIFAGGIGQRGPEFEFHDEIQGELPPSGELDVSLDTTNGRITVETWDGPGFFCDVRKKASARNEEEAKELLKDSYEFNQDGCIIRARSKEKVAGSWGKNVSIAFTLKLPKGRKSSLNLNSANGRISVDGISGTKMTADTANGRVEVTRCDFDSAEIDTANGRIEFQGSSRNLRLDTANGRIEARLAGEGNWKCDTANGRIEVEIAREGDIGYEVDVSSVMGQLEVTGMPDMDVIVDDTKDKFGSKRFKARTKGFENAVRKGVLKASSSLGRVTVSF